MTLFNRDPVVPRKAAKVTERSPESWWAEPGLSRAEFARKVQAEAVRMSSRGVPVYSFMARRSEVE